MWRAALQSRRTVAASVLLVALAIIADASAAAPASHLRAASARALPARVLGLDLAPKGWSRLGTARLRMLSTHGLNAIVVDSKGRSPRALERLAASAANAHLRVIRAVPVAAHQDVAAKIAACERSTPRAVACVPLARTVAEANRLIRHGQHVLVVSLDSPGQITTLRLHGDARIIAAPRFSTARRAELWKSAIARARSTAALGLAVAPVGRAQWAAVSTFIRLLDQAHRHPSGHASGKPGATLPPSTSTPTPPAPAGAPAPSATPAGGASTTPASAPAGGTSAGTAASPATSAATVTASNTPNAPSSTQPAPPPVPGSPPGAGGTLYVATNGSDANACTAAAPCASFQRAYSLAQPGASVSVAAGSYPSQQLSGSKSGGSCNALTGATSGCVTFAPAAGASVTVAGLSVGASFARVEGMTVTGTIDVVDGSCTSGLPRDVVLQDLNGTHFFIDGGQNVAVVGGSYGNVSDAQSSIQACNDYYHGSYASNVLVEGVRFHDYIWRTAGIHMECLHMSSVNTVSVINNVFVNCGIFDVMVNNVQISGYNVVAGNYFDQPHGLNGGSGGSAAIGLSPSPWHILHNVFAAGAGVADETFGWTSDTYPSTEIGFNVFADAVDSFHCNAYAQAQIVVHDDTFGAGGVACGTGSVLSTAALPSPPHVLLDGSLG